MFTDLISRQAQSTDSPTSPFARMEGQQVISPTIGNINYPIPDPTPFRTEGEGIDAATGKPTIGLSYSSAKQLSHCPRKYQLRKRFYQPDYSMFDSGLPAVSGSAIHEYIQSRLRGDTHEEATFNFFLTYNFDAEEAASDYNLRFRSLSPSYHTAIEAYRQINLRPNNVASFTSVSETNEDGEATETHIPGTEFKFEIIFRDEGWANTYIFRGAIDIITFHPDPLNPSHTIYSPWDIKCQRSSLETLEPDYRFSPQLIPYGLVIQHLTGEPIDNFTVNYLSIYTDLIDPKVTHYAFQKTSDDVNAWIQSTLLLISNMEAYHSQPVWPRSQTGCIAWNQTCKYYSICGETDPQTIQRGILRDGRYPHLNPRRHNPHVTIELEL